MAVVTICFPRLPSRLSVPTIAQLSASVPPEVKNIRSLSAPIADATCARALRNAFAALGDREKQILGLRFVGGKTQMEVAGALGISQAQVSRLEKSAISAMRKSVSIVC